MLEEVNLKLMKMYYKKQDTAIPFEEWIMTLTNETVNNKLTGNYEYTIWYDGETCIGTTMTKKET
jgi:hypothetical protein